jgi:ABC-type uncharacterized transport system substrate-binding protein
MAPPIGRNRRGELAAGKGRALITVCRIGFAIAALLSVAVAGPASAHPHVLVDARAEIVFDKTGAITAVRHIWQFDEAFTAFAIQGLDANNDGKLSDDELAPLAKVNVDSLKEYGFFTWLRQGRKSYPFVQPTEYWLEFHGGRLTLFYTLPLKQPVAIHGKATLEVFDPEYFVAFTFPEHKAVTLTGAPAGCTAEYQPPHMLDAQTMATLSAIPADQHDLPPELQDAAAGLANLIALNCPGAAGAAEANPFDTVMAGGDGKPDAGAAAPPVPPAAPADTAAAGDLTAADIAAAAPATASPPPPARPADPTTLVIADNGNAASAPSAAPAAAAPEESASGESSLVEIGAIVLAVLLAAGIAVAGFLLQRNLRRAR